MLAVNLKSITGQLQALTGEICRLPETNVEWLNHIEKSLELCDSIEGSDMSKQDKVHLESSAVSLWNHAVSSKFGGQLSTAANAKLRNLSFKMVHFCNSNTSDEVTLRKLSMMGLKTIRSWLDCNYSDRAEAILKVTMEANSKLKELFFTRKEDGQSAPTTEQEMDVYKMDIENNYFHLFCSQAEIAFAQGQYDTAYSHIQSAKDMLALFPKESGFICQLCYNFGVELYQKKYFDECIVWLCLSHDIGKDKKDIPSTSQSCTLRLLATAYLEFKTTDSNKKALNAINLANNFHNHHLGLLLKLRILLMDNETGDESVKNTLESLNSHGEFNVNIGLQSCHLLTNANRSDLSMEQLKYMTTRFSNSPEYGKVVCSLLVLNLKTKEVKTSKELVESIITAHNTNEPLDISTRKQLHYIFWEQAALAYEQKNYQEALEWYNYSYSLFSFSEYSDKNLAKVNRNRATCYIYLESFEKAREALSKAESYDVTSPYTQFIIFKLALLQKQQDVASKALQKMCEYASNNNSNEDGGNNNNDGNPSVFTADALIRLAAQMAFEKDETNLAATALEIFLKGSHVSAETLTALRCLIRLLLSDSEDNDRKSLSRLLEHLRSAYKYLSEVCQSQKDSQENKDVNIQLEATWFTKIAWNLAIQSEKSPDFLRDFFIICYKLSTLCPSDLNSMSQQKTCSLIVAAAYLQLASNTTDSSEKNTLLTEALNYVSSCRIVCNKILSEKLLSNENENKKDTVDKLLLLYEFESRAKLKDPMLESVLERAVMMPYSDAKMFETIAALAVDSPANYKNLSIRALKLALRKHLQSSLPDFMAVSKNFHSIIELCFSQSGGQQISETQSISTSQSDLFTYFEEVFEFIEQKAKDKYPEVEILWLMSKAWNFGIRFYSSGNYVEAEKWCGLGMKFQRHLSTLKNTYEKQISTVYTEILSKMKPAPWKGLNI
ncbi:testis-expressed protein 11 [Argonauta hians]